MGKSGCYAPSVRLKLLVCFALQAAKWAHGVLLQEFSIGLAGLGFVH